MLKSTLKYARRLTRMTSLLAHGTVHWVSFKMAMRPGQIAVLAAKGGFVFCDAVTDDNALPG